MLDRKLTRDLFAAKGLLAAIASIIAVGVMCYVTMQSAYHNLNNAKGRYYRQSRMADFWIDVKKAPLAELERLNELPEVAQLTPRISFIATVDLADAVHPINGQILSLPDQRRPVTNDIVMRRGGYFTAQRANEVIVLESFAEEHNLKPGDWIHLLLNNRRQELLIVGMAISSEFTYSVGPGSLMPDPARFGVFYVKRSFAEDVFDFDGAANQVVGRLAPGRDRNIEGVLRELERRLDDFGVGQATALEHQSSNQFLSGEIDGLGAFANVVPSFFLVVGALVLNVLIMRLARQQRTTIGTLKALGYGDRRLMMHIIEFGLCIGLAGGLAGCVMGFAAAASITQMYTQYFEFPELRSDLHWGVYGIGMAVSLATAMVGGWAGASSVLKLDPAAAMRPEPPRQGRAIVLERWTWFWQRLGSAWRVVLRGLSRHKVRTAIGAFAACVGAGLLVVGFMMLTAQNHLIEFQFRQVQRSDVDVSFGTEQGRGALDELRRLPGVVAVEPLLTVAGTLQHDSHRRKAAVTGLLPGAELTVPRDRQSRPIAIPESGLVISNTLGELLEVRIGDRVTLIPSKGERRPIVLEVVQTTDSFMGLTAYADIAYLSRAIGEPFAVNGAQLRTSRDPIAIDALYHQLKRTPEIESVLLREQMVEQLIETLMSTQWIFIAWLVGFAGVIFFGSIVNASIVNLTERQREVATLRAIGYGPWRIGGLFFRESLVTTLAGALCGFPFGFILMWLTAQSYDNELIRIPIIMKPWVFWTTMALATFFAVAAHGFVQWRIHAMDFVDALKIKE